MAFRIAEAALSHRVSSVFPGGLAHCLNWASQSLATTIFSLRYVERMKRQLTFEFTGLARLYAQGPVE
jgi:hypothetical protein